MMKYKKKFQKHTKGAQGKGSRNHEKEQRGCGRCGKTPSHSLTNCAARDAECHKCHKKGHYAALCKTKPSSVHEIQEEEVETVFLGSVSAGGQSKTWQKTLILNGQQTTFKLDTGADVTAIPAKVYSKKQHGPLTTATKRLLGPGDNALQVKEQEPSDSSESVPTSADHRRPVSIAGDPGISGVNGAGMLFQSQDIAVRAAEVRVCERALRKVVGRCWLPVNHS
ncbi:uncharacterized protein [Takifugu rubripes]|uniref:uncharacterized protein n=1 Tax=Takifugu rubripes TaxID=31033 RepID=UPI001145C06D|nr:uncharacterized protein LOC115253210 [Takifugu rubripes]